MNKQLLCAFSGYGEKPVAAPFLQAHLRVNIADVKELFHDVGPLVLDAREQVKIGFADGAVDGIEIKGCERSGLSDNGRQVVHVLGAEIVAEVKA